MAPKALGLDNKIGSIELGKQADLVAIDLRHPRTQPIYDAAATLAYSASAAQVSHVWIDGNLLVNNGQLTQLDLSNVLEEAKRWGAGIADAR
jgi:5-methylthioadenosine/S-adenosylhomocysteine deaminase